MNAAAAKVEHDARLTVELLAQLKHVTFLLSSARLVIADPVANKIATTAVENAQAVIKRAEAL